MQQLVEIDGRLLVILGLSAIFWSISAMSQRLNPYAPRVKTPRWLAFVLGSKTDKVMWRTATIQIGVVLNLICYAAILVKWNVSNLLVPAVISGTVMFVLQTMKWHK
jgi:hypothetical protein